VAFPSSSSATSMLFGDVTSNWAVAKFTVSKSRLTHEFWSCCESMLTSWPA